MGHAGDGGPARGHVPVQPVAPPGRRGEREDARADPAGPGAGRVRPPRGAGDDPAQGGVQPDRPRQAHRRAADRSDPGRRGADAGGHGGAGALRRDPVTRSLLTCKLAAVNIMAEKAVTDIDAVEDFYDRWAKAWNDRDADAVAALC